MARKTVDCREIPSESGCTLTISGEEEEVMRAAVMHAVDVHGHKDTSEVREAIRRSLREETASSRRA
jgi:predicted small metal-binding protein